MPGVARKPDLCTGHGCYPPRSSITASPDTIVNNLQVVRFGDIMKIHCCKDCHSGMHCEDHNVIVNNRPIQCCGDQISCGSSQAECSDNVIACDDE